MSTTSSPPPDRVGDGGAHGPVPEGLAADGTATAGAELGAKSDEARQSGTEGGAARASGTESGEARQSGIDRGQEPAATVSGEREPADRTDAGGAHADGADADEASVVGADEDADDASVDDTEYPVAEVVDPATVRRAPRFGRFIVLGIVLGALLSLALALLSPPSALARSDLFWLLFIGLGLLGGLAGAVVALLLDRRSWRRRAAERPRP